MQWCIGCLGTICAMVVAVTFLCCYFEIWLWVIACGHHCLRRLKLHGMVAWLFSAVRKKAQNGTNRKKDTFFGLIFCFQKTELVKNYFFALSKLGAFGVILTMQLEPPKTVTRVIVCTLDMAYICMYFSGLPLQPGG